MLFLSSVVSVSTLGKIARKNRDKMYFTDGANIWPILRKNVKISWKIQHFPEIFP